MPAEIPAAGVLDVVDEVRVGLSYHMVYWTMLPQNPQDWYWDRLEDVTFDVLFTSPDIDAFHWIGSPRPEVGATINLKGEDSLVHAGLTWQAHLFDTPLFIEGTFGGAIHSGYLGEEAPAGRRQFGCRVNFYERFGIGVDLAENATAVLAYEHTSNAGLCGHNADLSNFGLKLGWKF
jgi:lipid A 3-O-deacylase